MPGVSVVIPGYNHAPYLRQRIDSVLNQTFADMEVIILDDRSTDGSRDIVESYRGCTRVSQILYNDINTGSTFRQWEKGIGECKSDLIWIAESDDFADKSFLSNLVPKILGDERIGIVYCQSLQVNEYSQITGNWKYHTDDLDSLKFESDFQMFGTDYIRDFLIHKNTIPNASAVIFRKKYFDMAAGAEHGIKYCGDWIIWLKMLLLSDICFVAEPLNYFRRHRDSVIAKASRQLNPEKYREKYDRTMRKRFHSRLEEAHETCKSILQANYNYMLMETRDEELFGCKK